MKRTLPLLLWCLAMTLAAQSTLYQDYIRKYAPLAQEQMKRYGIPASITLAQGLLESGAGTSMLAQKANNHFGIKTGGTWTGPYVTKDDDKKAERFRKYQTPEESFEDHSLFLSQRQRYASLFNLDPTDYEGWAHGLKAAGYATNPEYARKLISLIEIYKLHEYDGSRASKHASRHHREPAAEAPRPERKPEVKPEAPKPAIAEQAPREVRQCNGVSYVKAREGDSFQTIAQATGVSAKKLMQYNEVDAAYTLRRGEPVFLQKKKAHVAESQRGKVVEVRAGQSLHSISQLYGVRLERIYRANGFGPDYQPRVGDRLILD